MYLDMKVKQAEDKRYDFRDKEIKYIKPEDYGLICTNNKSMTEDKLLQVALSLGIKSPHSKIYK